MAKRCIETAVKSRHRDNRRVPRPATLECSDHPPAFPAATSGGVSPLSFIVF